MSSKPKALEDLAKTAELLARPILHATKGKEHTFYIIDNNTKQRLNKPNKGRKHLNT